MQNIIQKDITHYSSIRFLTFLFRFLPVHVHTVFSYSLVYLYSPRKYTLPVERNARKICTPRITKYNPQASNTRAYINNYAHLIKKKSSCSNKPSAVGWRSFSLSLSRKRNTAHLIIYIPAKRATQQREGIYTGRWTAVYIASAVGLLYPCSEHKGRDYKLILNYENSRRRPVYSVCIYIAGGIIRSWSREWGGRENAIIHIRGAHKLAKLINEIPSIPYMAL